MNETGWVIERWRNSELFYWTGRNQVQLGSTLGWSHNSLEALRFARAKDAATVLSWLLQGEGRVAEHVWTDGVTQ